MAIAIILALILVASVLFHFLAPWHLTPPASNWGSIDTTLLITLVITGVFFIAVVGFMVVAIIRFRHREGRRARYEPESRRLEWWLMVVTSLGIVGMLAPGLVVYSDFVRVPKDAYPLEVVAQQWQWAFRFPGQDGQLGRADVKWVDAGNPLGLDPRDPHGQDDVLVRGNEVRLPLDRPVKVLLRSKDVLHNFYIPQIRGKMDMVPGMVSHFWFTPTLAGEYEILCAEFCGVGHFNMRGKLQVEPAPAFEQWLATQPTFAQLLASAGAPSQGGLIERGRQLADTHGCPACHSQDGSQSLGPGWKDLYGREVQLADGTRLKADAAYLRESILDPRARLVQGYPPVMVPYTFSQDELAALVAFIQSLSAVGQQESGGAGNLVEQGEKLAQSLGCLACHSLDGSKGVGPSWKGLYGHPVTLADGSQVEADAAYLRESVLAPAARLVQGYSPLMPAFTPSDTELDALIAFIRSRADPDADDQEQAP
ncbi:cytochrome B [Pseudomonas sp. A46]|nr:cytochrome c oxidase subunit II [Pseudomonas sp. A46]OWJ93242.1 cytochrome B [Pseudomonas sp. A46]